MAWAPAKPSKFAKSKHCPTQEDKHTDKEIRGIRTMSTYEDDEMAVKANEIIRDKDRWHRFH